MLIPGPRGEILNEGDNLVVEIVGYDGVELNERNTMVDIDKCSVCIDNL